MWKTIKSETVIEDYHVTVKKNEVQLSDGAVIDDFYTVTIPDAAMTVAALCLFAKGTSTIRGIHSWKVKETDRIQAMVNELSKTGAAVSATDDSITITPPKEFLSAEFETYNDHRMAMCMSLAAFGIQKQNSIRILDPLCVNKTYPAYWRDLKKLTGASFEIPRVK